MRTIAWFKAFCTVITPTQGMGAIKRAIYAASGRPRITVRM
jgi:hypothetical protein